MINFNEDAFFFVFVTLLWICFFALLIWKFVNVVLEKNKLKQEKQELFEENQRLEYVIEEHLLHYVITESELNNIFLNVAESCLQDKVLPKNFLRFVCGSTDHYEIMKKVLIEEIVRFSSLVTSDQFQNMSIDKVNGIVLKQKKLINLLSELTQENEKRNRHRNFAEAPDLLVDQSRVNHEQNSSVGGKRCRPGDMGGIVEM